MSNRSTIRIISTISWCWVSKGHSASSSSRLYANECWQDRRPKRAAANCSKGFRLGMPATPWVRSCFIPTDGSAKLYSSCLPSFENCGACVRHSNGSVITTWSYRSIPYRDNLLYNGLQRFGLTPCKPLKMAYPVVTVYDPLRPLDRTSTGFL